MQKSPKGLKIPKQHPWKIHCKKQKANTNFKLYMVIKMKDYKTDVTLTVPLPPPLFEYSFLYDILFETLLVS